MVDYLTAMLELTNVFISLFVLIFAWGFLKQTSDVKDRRPWVYLFIATIFFFVFQVFGALNLFGIGIPTALESLLQSVFIALILLTFIFQYDLILKSDLIVITRKLMREEKEMEEKRIAKELATTKKTSKKK